MAERCFKCGVEEGLGCRLTAEGLGGRRKYCPSCLKRVHRKANTISWLLTGIILTASAVAQARRGASLLDSVGAALIVLFVLQWLMTIPHELGHAWAARSLGAKNVRILIGTGSPFFSANALGFQWLINKSPFGGLTLVAWQPGLSRLRQFLFVAAGPATSGLAMLIVWLFFRPGEAWPSIHSWSGNFFWANAAVLMWNLIPYYTQSEGGRIPNDGMHLWHLMFGMPKAPSARKRRLASRGLKFVGVLLMALATVLFVSIAAFLLVVRKDDVTVLPRIALTSLFVGFAGISAFMGWRIARDQQKEEQAPPLYARGVAEIEALSKAVAEEGLASAVQERLNNRDGRGAVKVIDQALERFPGDVWLLFARVHAHLVAEEFREAVQAMDALPPLRPNAGVSVAGLKLYALVELDEFAAAEEVAEAWLRRWEGVEPSPPEAVEHRVCICDCIAAFPLMAGNLGNLERLKQWVERGLAFSPGNPDLKATLAAIAVEMGQYGEAEPLLARRIEDAENLQQKGFALFYLGLLRAGQRRSAEARRLLQQAMIVSDAPWLVKRATAALAKLEV